MVTLKKQKAKKDFQPSPIDEGDEFFPNGIFEFNIIKLLALIRTAPDLFLAQSCSVDELRTFELDHLDEATIAKADLSNPIVLAEIRPGRFNVIDGNHRLERAYRSSVKEILAYKIGPDHHTAFLTSAESYKAYVRYWNEKVNELSQ